MVFETQSLSDLLKTDLRIFLGTGVACSLLRPFISPDTLIESIRDYRTNLGMATIAVAGWTGTEVIKALINYYSVNY